MRYRADACYEPEVTLAGTASSTRRSVDASTPRPMRNRSPLARTCSRSPSWPTAVVRQVSTTANCTPCSFSSPSKVVNAISRLSGNSRRIAATASTPDITRIRRSINATSGFFSRHALSACSPRGTPDFAGTCETFNLPNHMNPSSPTTNLASSTFGRILSDISGNDGLDAGDLPESSRIVRRCTCQSMNTNAETVETALSLWFCIRRPAAECPACAAKDLEQLISRCAMSSETTRDVNLGVTHRRAVVVRREKQHQGITHLHEHFEDSSTIGKRG